MNERMHCGAGGGARKRARRGRLRSLALLTVLAAVLLLCASPALAAPEPPAEGYVADYADVLNADTEQYILENSQALDAATGAQIVVVTVDFLDGMTAEEYAYDIFNTWGIGDAEKDNGLLLLLAIGEQDYWAMQGQGLEEVLSSGILGEYLAEYLEPYFAAGEYDTGVREVYDALLAWFEAYYFDDTREAGAVAVPETPPEEPSQDGMGFGASLLALFLLFLVAVTLISFLRRNRDRRWRNRRYPPGSGGGGRYMPMGRPWVIFPPSRASRPAPPPRPGDFDDFGGGSSRGGGAGRSSGGFGGRGGFGGGSSRGGGAGRG